MEEGKGKDERGGRLLRPATKANNIREAKRFVILPEIFSSVVGQTVIARKCFDVSGMRSYQSIKDHSGGMGGGGMELNHKALANENSDIVADTNVSPFARARNICCGHKFCVRGTKNVSDFFQKHFVSATNVFQFARARKRHEQQFFLVCHLLYICYMGMFL